ncbi:penicillin-binding protein 1C [Parathalassolituus penaei]|uniref:peptidoglycan glycosyltransferase n=1 Tax=Parathalassolituus penaei TaxID=2997323 RepID=A0A9X3EE55_9GAMM|nr:penicillin-binding protein 1C [Parathalassolituus penaei]MCY0965894.1 penicillin-binding protein 1C [Parathalassolituus penaei]
MVIQQLSRLGQIIRPVVAGCPIIRKHPWLTLLLAMVLITPAAAWLLNRVYPLPLPGTSEERFAQTITDYRGQPLRAFADINGVWRYEIHQQQVAPFYLQALLAYEDRWFYQHPGVNPLAMARAAWQNLRCRCVVSGGSTLTMQVARLLDPHSRSLGGKLKQLWRAAQLEWLLSKDEILELYLNLAPMGGPVEGVEAASRLYLNKASADLSLAESALLAVLPQSPSRLRPDRYPERAQQARNKVLKRLLDFGLISEQQYREALLERVLAATPRAPMLAPLLARQLHQQFPHQAVIRTSIDADIQATLERLLRDEIRRYPAGQSAAILVVDNHSHQVRAYLGSADFLNNERFGHVDMVQAIRSPGSTLKPFIYGLALEEGLIHSASLLADVPRHRKQYRPENFARDFSGPTDPQTALRYSLNLPAVQVLEALTPEHFATALANVRTPWQLPKGSQPSLALALGGGGFNLWQLVTLYSSLANEGQVYPLQTLATEPDSRATNNSEQSPRWLFSPATAWVVGHLLRNPRPNRVRTPQVKDALPLAWKTGTSYGFRDAWAIGVTPDYSIGVWLGRPDGTPSPGQFGSLNALPLLFRLQQRLDRQPQWPAAPSEVSEQRICWPLGLAASSTQPELCHQQRDAWIIRGQIPPTLRDTADGLMPNPMTIRVSANGLLISGDCDAAADHTRQLALWPRVLEPWLAPQWRLQQQLPALHPGCHNNDLVVAPLQITGLEPGSWLAEPTGSHQRNNDDNSREIQLVLGSLGGYGSKDWYLNGQYVGTSTGNQSPTLQLTTAGPQELVVIDEQGSSDRLAFYVN